MSSSSSHRRETTFTTPPRAGPAYSSPSGATRAATTARTTTAALLSASPAYTTNLRKHSLYGTEDRVIIDPGSRIWKIGFSNEPSPRKVFYSVTACNASRGADTEDEAIWDVDFGRMEEDLKKQSQWGLLEDEGDEGDGAEWVPVKEEQPESSKDAVDRIGRQEVEDVIKARLIRNLRDAFFKHLLSDSKSRKVIVVENALLPQRIKQLIAEVLLENLHVPSVSFVPSHMLALLAVGRSTGLVVDVGYLETTVLPVISSRIIYPRITTTPKASRHFLNLLRRLIIRFGTWYPPPANTFPPNVLKSSKARAMEPLGPTPSIPNLRAAVFASTSIPTATGNANAEASSSRIGVKVPEEVLTREVMEDIRSKGCFVGDEPEDVAGTMQVNLDQGVNQPVTTASTSSTAISADAKGEKKQEMDELDDLDYFEKRYAFTSRATDMSFMVPVGKGRKGTNPVGIVIVPGWIRERVAEIFFEEGEGDEGTLTSVILDCLLKVPADLRESLISSILIIGGGCMLPGFIPRLRKALLSALVASTPKEEDADWIQINPPSFPASLPASTTELKTPTTASSSSNKSTAYQIQVIKRAAKKGKLKHLRPYEALHFLKPHLAILNDPAPPPRLPDQAATSSGTAPPWTPSAMAWVGGSIAGALQIGGEQITLEQYDEAAKPAPIATTESEPQQEVLVQSNINPTLSLHLRDWSRTMALSA